MKRIRCDLMFGNDTDAGTVWNALKTYLATKQIKNIVNEKSYIHYEECHHASSPPAPCVTIERFEKT